MIGDDILSVLFLAFVCLIVSGLVYKLVPQRSILLVPSFILIAIGLWISYDYILLRRYKAKEQCNKQKNIREIHTLVDEINNDAYEGGDLNSQDLQDNQNPKKATPVEKLLECDFDIDVHNQVDIRDMYHHMGSSGDNQIANRMKYLGMQPQLSKNIRAAHNRYTLQPYFEEELRENEEREWWNNDALEADF